MSIAFAEPLDPWVPLASAADLTGFSGGPFPEPVINSAGDSLRDECGWHIGPEVKTVARFRGSDASPTPIILLPTLKLIDVVSVTDRRGNQLYGLDWLENGILERDGGFPPWVEVTFWHGFKSCPRSLLAIIAERARANAGGRIKSEALAGRSVTLEGGYDPASAKVINAYKVTDGP